LATNLVLLGREFVAPFGIGFCNWCSHQVIMKNNKPRSVQSSLSKNIGLCIIRLSLCPLRLELRF
jgi:hypothetical protein